MAIMPHPRHLANCRTYNFPVRRSSPCAIAFKERKMKAVLEQVRFTHLWPLGVLLASTIWAGAAVNSQAKLTLEDLVDATGLSSVDLSPDGRQFAIVHSGQIALVSSDGGWPVELTTTPGGKQGIKWSPDGRSIAFVSEGAIWTVPAVGGQPIRLTDGRHGAGDPRSAADRDPRWSPNGKWILFETGRRGNADLGVVSKDGLSTNLLTSSPADEENPSWSLDGSRIAYVERSTEHFSGRLLAADFDQAAGRFEGEPKVLYTAQEDRGGGWSIRRPEWSPDGRSLA